MWKTLCAFLFVSALSAPASAQEFSCYLIDNFDDWTIQVDTASGEAGFFDNDTWTTLKRVASGQLKKNPPERFHVFRELDSRNSPFGLLIHFNEYRLSATLTEDIDTAKRRDYEFFCKRAR
ncbi:MAG: hypothetical protein A2X94_11420 [Bdellovibrionales bacterium GWB1_55_8]|nr:MAG: hypothetical protein A2X94_11420 [Bdellovibrionales bacterium GWB1_55_8]